MENSDYFLKDETYTKLIQEVNEVMMEIRDDVIIDGNAVYEIDPDCEKSMTTSEKDKSEDSLDIWLILLLLYLLKRIGGV